MAKHGGGRGGGHRQGSSEFAGRPSTVWQEKTQLSSVFTWLFNWQVFATKMLQKPSFLVTMVRRGLTKLFSAKFLKICAAIFNLRCAEEDRRLAKRQYLSRSSHVRNVCPICPYTCLRQSGQMTRQRQMKKVLQGIYLRNAIKIKYYSPCTHCTYSMT